MLLKVNGVFHDLAPTGHETLLTLLRERLHLTGAKLVCGRGECGACTVLVEDAHDSAPVPIYACLTLAAGCDGYVVTTVEGLAHAGALHRVQEAFIEHDASQCGFCTPGQLLAAVAVLARHPDPTGDDVKRGMSGNLCRCGTYPRIVDAIMTAARRLREPANG
jgi:aerobic-type carbon monoxide dehydrogenase small subunit (CoxS/CutS family)